VGEGTTPMENLKKLITLKDDPALAIHDELTEANAHLSAIEASVSEDKTIKVEVINQQEIDPINLTPLTEEVASVREELLNTIRTIEGIGKVSDIKGIDLSPIASILKEIASKEQKIDLLELKVISKNLSDLLYLSQSLALEEKPGIQDNHKEMMMDILNLINDNLVAIEIPEFDYERIVEAIRNIKIVSGGGGIGALNQALETNVHTENVEVRTFQENHICTDNTTTTPLGSNATFTGAWQDCLNYQEVNVSIIADQDSAVNGLVFQWSADGVNIGDTDSYSYYTASGGTNYTPNPSFRYIRMVYTNGSVAQGSFSLQTILRRAATGGSFHRIDSTLKDDSDGRLRIVVPKLRTAQNNYISQSATNLGNTKVSLEELESGISVNSNSQLKVTQYDSIGNEKSNPYTAFGDLRTAELSPLIQFSFEYTVDNTELTASVVSGSGAVTQADAMAIATTGTTTASIAKMICKQHARYRAGLGGLMRFTALFTTGVASTSQWVGLLGAAGSSADFKDGFAVGYNGATFGIARFKNDSLTFTALADCDDPLDGTGRSGITLDTTKLNVFGINYQYLGAGAIRFYVEDGDGYFHEFHKIDYSGLNTTPSVYNPNFHLAMYANNKATTSNLVVKSASMAYFVEGKTGEIETQQFVTETGRRQKTAVTTEIALFTIRNRSTYASKANLISVKPIRLSLGIDANAVTNLGQFRLVKNTTLGGTPSYSDIDTANSLIEIDTAGTTLTGGTNLITGDLAGQNDKNIENISDYDIYLHPGESITLAVQSATSATFNGSIAWKELF